MTSYAWEATTWRGRIIWAGAHPPPPERQQHVPDGDGAAATVLRQDGHVAHHTQQKTPQLGLRLLVDAARHALHTCGGQAPLQLREQIGAPGKILGEVSAATDPRNRLAIASAGKVAPLPCAGIARAVMSRRTGRATVTGPLSMLAQIEL